jgi:hypothetical protein
VRTNRLRSSQVQIKPRRNSKVRIKLRRNHRMRIRRRRNHRVQIPRKPIWRRPASSRKRRGRPNRHSNPQPPRGERIDGPSLLRSIRATIRPSGTTRATSMIPTTTGSLFTRNNHRRRCRNTASLNVRARIIYGHPVPGHTPPPAITGFLEHGSLLPTSARSGRLLIGRSLADAIDGTMATGARTSDSMVA